MNLELYIARRTALSEGGRPAAVSRIATGSVALGMAVMIVAVAVIAGFRREVTARLTGFAAPVEVTDTRSLRAVDGAPLTRTPELERLIAAGEGFGSMSVYALRGGIVRTAAAMEGVLLRGVDGAADLSFYEAALAGGRMPRIGDSVRAKEILLSTAVARRLELVPDDRVEMLFVDESTRPRRDRFRVAGLYEAGMEQLAPVALTDLRNVQRLWGWESDRVTGYDVRIADAGRAGEYAAQLEERLYDYEGGADGEVPTATAVADRYPMLFDWLGAHDVNGAVVIGVMVAVALFNMISALLILVLERTRMIGLLKTLGMPSRRVGRIFLWRAAFLVGRGMLWGNLAGVGLCAVQKYLHVVKLDPAGYLLAEVPVSLGAGWWLALNAGVAAVILLLLVVPSRIVASIRPAESLQYE